MKHQLIMPVLPESEQSNKHIMYDEQTRLKDCVIIENSLEYMFYRIENDDADIKSCLQKIIDYAQEAAYCQDESDIQSYISTVNECTDKIESLVDDLITYYGDLCEYIDSIKEPLKKYNGREWNEIHDRKLCKDC